MVASSRVRVKGPSYQFREDSYGICPEVVVSLGLAAVLHADMDEYPLLDILWMIGLFLGVVAVLPQLCQLSRTQDDAGADEPVHRSFGLKSNLERCIHVDSTRACYMQ